MKVLFITHDTSRTGAPLLLLNYIKWLKEEKFAIPVILIGRSDESDAEFKKIGKVFYSYRLKNSIGKNLFYKIFVRLFNSGTGRYLYNNVLKFRFKFSNINLIYSNTICNGYEMEFLKFLNVKQICHVHEGYDVIEMWGQNNLELVKRNASVYIACSNFVKSTLINKFGLSSEKIKLIYGSVNKSIFLDNVILIDQKLSRTNLDRPFLIGGSGGISTRKGTDLIVPLMKILSEYSNDIHFLWVGGNAQSIEFNNLEEQINKSGLKNRIKIISAVSKPIEYYLKYDLFILLSREDPFPLVCLENAMLGNSVLCFGSSGGISELLSECEDNIIPFLNLEKMAQRILYLSANLNENIKIGTMLKAKVLQNYTSDICFPIMYEVMNKNILPQTT